MVGTTIGIGVGMATGKVVGTTTGTGTTIGVGTTTGTGAGATATGTGAAGGKGNPAKNGGNEMGCATGFACRGSSGIVGDGVALASLLLLRLAASSCSCSEDTTTSVPSSVASSFSFSASVATSKTASLNEDSLGAATGDSVFSFCSFVAFAMSLFLCSAVGATVGVGAFFSDFLSSSLLLRRRWFRLSNR